MKLLIVNHYAVAPGYPGGTRHSDLAREWAKLGHDVRIVSSAVNHFAKDVRNPSRENLGCGSEIVALSCPRYRGNTIGRALNMAVFAAQILIRPRIVRGFDIYIGSSPHPFAALATAIVARINRAEFIFEIRDLWPQTLIDLDGLSQGAFLTSLLYRLERWLVKRAACVIYVPPGVPDYLAEKGLKPRSSRHIPNVPHGREDSAQNDVAVGSLYQRVADDGQVVFCYTGSLGPANALESVIRAFADKRTPTKAVLIVVGGGPEEAALRELAKRLRCRVTFTGQTSRSGALATLGVCDVALFHLRDADVFRYGLSPNKLMDYLQAGKPILYAGPDVPNPIAGADCTVRATPCDAADIARAVREIVELTPENRRLLGANARRWGLANYSLDIVSRKYLRVLEDVHSSSKGC